MHRKFSLQEPAVLQGTVEVMLYDLLVVFFLFPTIYGK